MGFPWFLRAKRVDNMLKGETKASGGAMSERRSRRRKKKKRSCTYSVVMIQPLRKFMEDGKGG